MPAPCARLRIGHFETLERIEDNLRYNQTSVLFVVGGNDIPRRGSGACRTDAFPISLHVIFSVAPLLCVCRAKFPVLVRLANTRQKTLALLLLREVQEELDDAGTVDVQVSLEVCDRTIPLTPQLLIVMRRVREPLSQENVAMHAHDQHFLVIGSVEDADAATFG